MIMTLTFFILFCFFGKLLHVTCHFCSKGGVFLKKSIINRFICLILIVSLSFSIADINLKKVDAASIAAGYTFAELLFGLAVSVYSTYVVYDTISSDERDIIEDATLSYVNACPELVEEQENLKPAVNNVIKHDFNKQPDDPNKFGGLCLTSKVSKAVYDILTEDILIEHLSKKINSIQGVNVTDIYGSTNHPVMQHSVFVPTFDDITSTPIYQNIVKFVTNPEHLYSNETQKKYYLDLSLYDLAGVYDYLNSDNMALIFIRKGYDDILSFNQRYNGGAYQCCVGYKFSTDFTPNIYKDYLNDTVLTDFVYTRYCEQDTGFVKIIQYDPDKSPVVNKIFNGYDLFPGGYSDSYDKAPYTLYLLKNDMRYMFISDYNNNWNKLAVMYNPDDSSFYNCKNGELLVDNSYHPPVKKVYVNDAAPDTVEKKSYIETINNTVKKLKPKSRNNPDVSDLTTLPKDEIIEYPYIDYSQIELLPQTYQEINDNSDIDDKSQALTEALVSSTLTVPSVNDLTSKVPEPLPDAEPAEPSKPDSEQTDDLTKYNYENPDLRDIFPFCIPFDFANIISLLEAEPKAISFEIPCFTITKSYTLKKMDNGIKVDLALFDDVAALFRKFMLIVFILGLILASSKLIGGGKT